MLPISEFLQSLADKYMSISMQWATSQPKECKQKKRMTHEQKYRRRRVFLTRICIVCSYVRFFLKPPLTFKWTSSMVKSNLAVKICRQENCYW